MILTHTFVVGGKAYKTGTSKEGKTWQMQSFKAYPFEAWVSVFLPQFIHEGMTVTVSGTVKKEESTGDNGQAYTNYSLQYPTYDTVYVPKADNPQGQTQAQVYQGYGEAPPEPFEEENLPF